MEGIRHATAPTPTHPWSSQITGIRFRLDTVRNAAPGNGKIAYGSDNWAITWAHDDAQYTSWGDGGGFDGDDHAGRVSMGIARIEGGPRDYSARNLNGGVDPESGLATWPDEGEQGGKCYGILSVDLSDQGGRPGTLYLFRAGWRSGVDMFRRTELWKSTYHGLSWAFAGVRWEFDGPDAFFCPTFCQAGRDHALGGEHVHAFAPEVGRSVTDDPWNVQVPGRISLMRCRAHEMEAMGNWEYFAGLRSGEPSWTRNVAARQPVFVDERNGVMRTSAIYVGALDRYILITQQVSRHYDDDGHIGIYEAPAPWGPWRTVLFGNPWRIGLHVLDRKRKTVYWNISPKWQSADGREFVLVFTGPGSDQWGTVEAEFLVGEE